MGIAQGELIRSVQKTERARARRALNKFKQALIDEFKLAVPGHVLQKKTVSGIDLWNAIDHLHREADRKITPRKR